MLEHAAQNRQDICEPSEFVARSSWPPASLCGPLPPLWTFAFTTVCDGIGCPYAPLAFGL